MLFSIIIPSYNRADLIFTTIQSALNQTYPNFEVLVIDDGSTDNTQGVLKVIKDKRFAYYYKTNEERAAARNYGINIAKGDYITFLDSDDILMPNHLEQANSFLKKEINPEWFHLGYKIADSQNKTLKEINNLKESIEKKLLTGNFLSCMGVFLRKDIADKNFFNTQRELSASEDHELWLRLAAQFPLKICNKVTSIIINHDARSVLTINKKALIIRQELFQKLILSNPDLKSFINGNQNKLQSFSYSYISLHLALTGKEKTTTVIYLLKSIKYNIKFIFTKRFIAIVKHLLFTW